MADEARTDAPLPDMVGVAEERAAVESPLDELES